MTKHRTCANGESLPVAILHEIHDCLSLALDATDGNQSKLWQMPAARSYMRSALRDTRRLLGEKTT
ncbi:hypothetical protein [Ruegeria arenilitoris]|uniref:hypothetical protein n=1 Tax=Ruegeria arenilitoris TaxID=1173585 RepID=UPI003C7ED91A